MWEYRIFRERDFSEQIPDFLELFDEQVEERTDYYYDFHQPQYGLKERLESDGSQSKIELKIRYDKDTTLGAEYWHKVVSHNYKNLPSEHLPVYQVDEILSGHAQEDDEFGSDIEMFQQNAGTSFKITEITKRRWEKEVVIQGELFDVEFVEVDIGDETVYSFGLEGEDIDLMEQLITLWSMDEATLTGGYPTLVSAINQITQPTPLIRN